MARILLVDDEPSILNVLTALLRKKGYEVTPTGSGESALELISKERFDLLLTDIIMGKVSGLDLLREINKRYPNTAIITLTGMASVETAVEAMKGGAFDYITKPFKVDELLLTIQRALEYHYVIEENVVLKAQLESRFRLGDIVAVSPGMCKVCDMIEKVAPTDVTVLITGESGTGKDLVAKAIHTCSRRQDKKFIPVNCAAMPEPLLESEMFGHVKGAFTGASCDKQGLFEAAEGGTIFLDEIGAMPLSIQAKFLRVLQDKQIRRVGGTNSVNVDVRVVVATNIPLEKRIEEGAFREDLFYRISVIPIVVEPLRNRREDILPLAAYFMEDLHGKAQQPRIDSSVQKALMAYDWPGNVRELQNAVQHALAFAHDKSITLEVLPKQIRKFAEGRSNYIESSKNEDKNLRGQSLKHFLRKKEQDYVSMVVDSMGGDKVEAAKALNVSVATLYRKLSGS